jgi:hypothetical protein
MHKSTSHPNRWRLMACAPLFVAFFLGSLSASAQRLVNTNATLHTKAVKKFLDDVFDQHRGMLSGQCNDSYFPYIYSLTGKYPAIDCFDFNGVTPTGHNSGWNDDQKAIQWFQKQNGLVAFQWHWQSPDGTGQWNPGDFNLASALANTNGSSYKNMLRDIDIVAGKIKNLQDADVPIIWRPLHEAEGQWFWWGASGKASCITLYRLIYERFVNYWHLNNIIWVWNSYGTEKGSWYPGDDVVDIIAWDYENSNSWNEFQQLFAGKGKLFALAEEGKLPDPNNYSARPWLYVVCWDYMIQDPSQPNGKNPADWLKTVLTNPKTINQSDLPKWVGGLSANAGSDRTILDAADNGSVNVLLDGSASTNTGGSIVSYTWKEGSTNLGTGVQLNATLGWGMHVISLTVSDASNATASASARITIKRQNLALNKPASVSSTETGANVASNAVDGNDTTRWSSAYSDPQFFYVDLKKYCNINSVILTWENASAKDFTVDVSSDAKTWTTIATETGMPAGARVDTLTGLNATARFVRMSGTARTSAWGYSLYEMEVNGTDLARPPQLLCTAPGFGYVSNQFGFKIQAVPGQVLVVEATSDPITWLSDQTNVTWWPVQTNVVTPGTDVVFFDVTARRHDRGYYRARLVARQVPSPEIAVPAVRSNRFSFRVSGISGESLLVETSTNLIDWTPLTTNILAGDNFLFTDTASVAPGNRFYRAKAFIPTNFQ